MTKEIFRKTVKVYCDKRGREPFLDWLKGLRDMTVQARIQNRIRNISLGLLGDSRSVGEGVFELRFQFGSGFRVYFGEENESVVLLLCGGDKRSQVKDIKIAKAYWREYQELKRCEK